MKAFSFAARAASAALLAVLLAPSAHAQASTNDDARRCVTDPVVGDGRRYCGAGTYTAAVTNQCAQRVEALLCMRTRQGPWDCRSDSLPPGRTWSQSFCHGNGEETYMDAVTTATRNRNFNFPN